ncbi:DUF5132 domain-containing protein [Chlorogloeopsis sp. ULAP01]|uniref:DUF5132 domain-containing protein n=1 Tax=Chlorogloeopsis sp. ULAP01 TaxID=3056483 RepID=UPI0025AB0C40|nr:DUF5132 domain-containing protein [Chlorogloeopsis sp. ULAP01]MDM9381976.1 DUF5132 domain-containing protein [Chlorogloeopsis sp. ULAP01]
MGVKVLPDVGDVAENLGVTGILGVVLLPIFLPVLAGVGKPIAKGIIKGGILFYEKSRGAIAEVGETWEDIVAEARAELGESRMKSAEPIEETQA